MCASTIDHSLARPYASATRTQVYVALPDRSKDPWTPDSVPWWVLGLIFAVSNAHGVVQTAMFMGQMAFFNQVSRGSARLGGTYMTLLNTASNLGSMWCGPLALKLVDVLGGRGLDGYAWGCALGTAYCAAWWLAARGRVRALQALGDEAWRVR